MDRFDDGSYEVTGAAMEVHRELGPGYKEAIYQEALGIELKARGIQLEKEVPVIVSYKGQPLETEGRADLMVGRSLVIELKATAALVPANYTQIIHYLKATGIPAGLLLNFGAPSLEYKHVIYTPKNNSR